MSMQFFSHRVKSVLFFLILALAALIRVWQLGSNPVSLYWDEVAMLTDARVVAETGKDMHGHPATHLIFPSYGDYKLAPYIWTAAASVKFFGATEAALRLPSVIAGLWTIIVAGLIARRLLGPKTDAFEKDAVQLLTMLVVTISPWSILFSRTAFEGHLGQALMATSIWLALQNSWASVVAGSFIGIAASYTYFSVRYVWPGTFVLSQLWVATAAQQLTISFKKARVLAWFSFTRVLVPLALFGVASWLFTFSPLYNEMTTFRLSADSVLSKQDEYVNTANYYRQLSGNSLLSRLVYHRWWLMGIELAKNYADHLNLSFLFIHGDPNLRHGTGQHGLFLIPLLPMFLLGWLAWVRRSPLAALLLAGWWVFALLPASVPENTPHALRSLNALVPLSIVIGFGMYMALRVALTTWDRFTKLRLLTGAAVGLYIVWLGLSTTGFVYHYFTQYPIDSANDWQEGYREAVQRVSYHRKPGQPVLITRSDQLLYVWFLAYGSYEASKIQTWETKDWKLGDFDNISFHAGEAEQQAMPDALVLIQSPSEAELHDTKTKEVISGLSGKPLFAIQYP